VGVPMGVTLVSPGAPVLTSSASDVAPPAVTSDAELFVAAHYDRATRRVALHILMPAFKDARWAAYPDLHCVAVISTAEEAGPAGAALDLATLGRFPGPTSTDLVSRARLAWDRASQGSPPHTLSDDSSTGRIRAGRPRLVMSGPSILVLEAGRTW